MQDSLAPRLASSFEKSSKADAGNTLHPGEHLRPISPHRPPPAPPQGARYTEGYTQRGAAYWDPQAFSGTIAPRGRWLC